jgi:hypothetical protein
MLRHVPFACLVVLFAACASNTSGDDSAIVPGDDGGTGGNDSGSGKDGAPKSDSGGGGDGSSACTLGTTTDCGSCGTACGTSDKASLYACSDATAAGTCTLTCRAEYYDLDGKIDDGCEAEDAVVQDSATNAVGITLPDANDSTFKTNPLNVLGYVYGDGRPHEDAPTSRPLGREDWYKVTAVGAGVPSTGMGACLGISDFPTDDTFEVCITDLGGSTFPSANCKAVKGGAQSSCVAPSGGSDAGDYYVRVRKTDGSNTPNGYALFLQH